LRDPKPRDGQAGAPQQQLTAARAGVGPFLQRDYFAGIERACARPSELMALVRRHFSSLAPEELAAFRCPHAGRELCVGDEIDIHIRAAGECRVRVTHADAQSLTLGTLEGHPEAGRITFGAYRDESGELIFHIRSRARSDSLLRLLGFVMAGEAMQTNTWTDFISRVAVLAGGSARAVSARMQAIEDDEEEEAVRIDG